MLANKAIYLAKIESTKENRSLPMLASTASGIHSSPSDSESEWSTTSTGIGSLAINSWKDKKILLDMLSHMKLNHEDS